MPDFVYIPVPSEWATAVYKQLAELSEGSSASSGAASDGENVQLDDALIERMYAESHAPHRRLLDYLADHPDEWVYTSGLAEALDVENGARGVAGMLGAFGKRANHRYGGLKPWKSDWDGTREEAKHRMDAEVARVITAIRSQ
jgi:hypothetical protein